MAERNAGGDGVVARLTPYELVFGGDFERDRFPAIREEAEALGADVRDPERFLLLGKVTELLRELSPDEAGADLYGRYGALLYQAYQFWAFGKRLYVLDAGLARRLVEGTAPVGGWEMTPPHPAGYLQLPRHLFWSRVEENSPAEPVDGFFWTMIGAEDPLDPPYRRLDAVLILGVRADRPGFSTIPIGSALVQAPLGHWADADARPGGSDFENVLPGGELQDWYAIVTELEAFKLISRIFWYVAAEPAALGEESRAAAAEPPSPYALPPSALPFRTICEAGL